MKENYSTRSIVFAVRLDCSSSRIRRLVFKSAAVAASVCPPRAYGTSVGISGKNNGVVCAYVVRNTFARLPDGQAPRTARNCGNQRNACVVPAPIVANKN